jgi:ketosteroid isomerase-like protein
MKHYLLLFLSVLFISCSSTHTDKKELSSSDVEELLEVYLEGWNEGDIEKVRNTLNYDAVAVNGKSVYKGLTTIERGWVQNAIKVVKNISVEPYVMGGKGEVAYMSGKYNLEISDAAGVQKDSGNLSLIWNLNEQNEWKLVLIHIEAY